MDGNIRESFLMNRTVVETGRVYAQMKINSKLVKFRYKIGYVMLIKPGSNLNGRESVAALR
jgi:hypothetical protein